MIDRWIAEATECDFKVALEVRRPKSWLKTVSAFANGIGGTLIFGINDERQAIGLTNPQADAEASAVSLKTVFCHVLTLPLRRNGSKVKIFLY